MMTLPPTTAHQPFFMSPYQNHPLMMQPPMPLLSTNGMDVNSAGQTQSGQQRPHQQNNNNNNNNNNNTNNNNNNNNTNSQNNNSSHNGRNGNNTNNNNSANATARCDDTLAYIANPARIQLTNYTPPKAASTSNNNSNNSNNNNSNNNNNKHSANSSAAQAAPTAANGQPLPPPQTQQQQQQPTMTPSQAAMLRYSSPHQQQQQQQQQQQMGHSGQSTTPPNFPLRQSLPGQQQQPQQNNGNKQAGNGGGSHLPSTDELIQSVLRDQVPIMPARNPNNNNNNNNNNNTNHGRQGNNNNGNNNNNNNNTSLEPFNEETAYWHRMGKLYEGMGYPINWKQEESKLFAQIQDTKIQFEQQEYFREKKESWTSKATCADLLLSLVLPFENPLSCSDIIETAIDKNQIQLLREFDAQRAPSRPPSAIKSILRTAWNQGTKNVKDAILTGKNDSAANKRRKGRKSNKLSFGDEDEELSKAQKSKNQQQGAKGLFSRVLKTFGLNGGGGHSSDGAEEDGGEGGGNGSDGDDDDQRLPPQSSEYRASSQKRSSDNKRQSTTSRTTTSRVEEEESVVEPAPASAQYSVKPRIVSSQPYGKVVSSSAASSPSLKKNPPTKQHNKTVPSSSVTPASSSSIAPIDIDDLGDLILDEATLNKNCAELDGLLQDFYKERDQQQEYQQQAELKPRKVATTKNVLPPPPITKSASSAITKPSSQLSQSELGKQTSDQTVPQSSISSVEPVEPTASTGITTEQNNDHQRLVDAEPLSEKQGKQGAESQQKQLTTTSTSSQSNAPTALSTPPVKKKTSKKPSMATLEEELVQVSSVTASPTRSNTDSVNEETKLHQPSVATTAPQLSTSVLSPGIVSSTTSDSTTTKPDNKPSESQTQHNHSSLRTSTLPQLSLTGPMSTAATHPPSNYAGNNGGTTTSQAPPYQSNFSSPGGSTVIGSPQVMRAARKKAGFKL
jgi:hypothetical protein